MEITIGVIMTMMVLSCFVVVFMCVTVGADEVHATLQASAKMLYETDFAGNVRILYGGSVKVDNVKGLSEQPDKRGFLQRFFLESRRFFGSV